MAFSPRECGVPFFFEVHWPPAHEDKRANSMTENLGQPVNTVETAFQETTAQLYSRVQGCVGLGWWLGQALICIRWHSPHIAWAYENSSSMLLNYHVRSRGSLQGTVSRVIPGISQASGPDIVQIRLGREQGRLHWGRGEGSPLYCTEPGKSC